MSHTLYQNLYHLIWSTKERKLFLNAAVKERVFEYLGGSLKQGGCISLQVGGMADHVHILASIPPKYAVSNIVRDIKVCSSKWLRITFPEFQQFAWQEGFGSFTVSTSQKDAVISYIQNQEKHHSQKDFKNKFVEFLQLHEVEYDERYLWQ